MQAIGCILGFVVGIFLFLVSVGMTIMYRIRRAVRQAASGQQQSQQNGQQQSSAQTKQTGKKLFGDDEGEYVEFEEIKD